jgi:hypothetical protein
MERAAAGVLIAPKNFLISALLVVAASDADVTHARELHQYSKYKFFHAESRLLP